MDINELANDALNRGKVSGLMEAQKILLDCYIEKHEEYNESVYNFVTMLDDKIGLIVSKKSAEIEEAEYCKKDASREIKPKVKCHICNRKVRPDGMKQHIKDKHERKYIPDEDQGFDPLSDDQPEDYYHEENEQ